MTSKTEVKAQYHSHFHLHFHVASVGVVMRVTSPLDRHNGMELKRMNMFKKDGQTGRQADRQIGR